MPPTEEEGELISAEALDDDRLLLREPESHLETDGGIDTLARSAVLLEVSVIERLFLFDGVEAAETVTGEGLARLFEPSLFPVRTIIIGFAQVLCRSFR